MTSKKASATRKRAPKRPARKKVGMDKASTGLVTAEIAFQQTTWDKARAKAVEANIGQTRSLRDLLKSTGWS